MDCDGKMRDKILKEALEWYEQQENNPDIEEFVDLVIGKTTDNIFNHIQKEFEEEFKKGILEHPFFISSEYYLELKLKDVKNKYLKEKKNQEKTNPESQQDTSRMN
jgi:hypothetical protein